jgi:hypothetical protein
MTGVRRGRLAAAAAGVALALIASARPSGQAGRRFVGTIDEHPAIDYVARPSSDRVATANRALAAGHRTLSRDPRLGYLLSVLDALGVPLESQVLVFSKTGVQRDVTGPANPRALYFNDSVVVGYIAGAPLLEIAAHDAQQGIQFYTLDQTEPTATMFRRRTECLSCHISVSTLEVPGVIARSNMVGRDGGVMPRLGSFTVNHRTPHTERWGGWFVTADTTAPAYIQLGNLGNTTVAMHPTSGPALFSNHAFVEWQATPAEQRRYPSALSDIASLMMFDHQMHAMNLLTRLNWEARVMASDGPLDVRAPEMRGRIEELVDYLLFVGEAPLALTVTPRPGLAGQLIGRLPRDRKGRSLGQFDLEQRLMRYPCSYMIYSPAFDGLPPAVKDALYRRLFEVLEGRPGDPKYAHLSTADRGAIAEILGDTRADLPADVRQTLRPW